MAMVVSNWQDHSSHHSADDVNRLPPLSQPPIDTATTLSHHPNMASQQASAVPQPSQPQLHQPAGQGPCQPDPSSMVHPPQTPTTPGTGSVSDGSNAATSLGDCSSNTRPQEQPGPSNSSEKPHIECVVSDAIRCFYKNNA